MITQTQTAHPTRPLLQDVQNTPWIRNTKVGDSTFGQVADRALQFAFEGNGPIADHTIVPQTAAAARALEGKQGPALEQALRGIAATVSGHESNTSFKGISLARGYRDFQVNSAISYLEPGKFMPMLSDAFSTKPTKQSKLAVKDALKNGDQVAHMAVAQAPGWVNLGPFASRQVMRLAGEANSTKDAKLGTWLASIGAHEPLHTVTPPGLKDLVKKEYLQWPTPTELEKKSQENPFAAMKPINWLEEGTADTLALWPGRIQQVGARMGVPTLSTLPEPEMPDEKLMSMIVGFTQRKGRLLPEERTFLDTWAKEKFNATPKSDLDRVQLLGMTMTGGKNYPVHIDAMQRLLKLANIDPEKPQDYAAAESLLQGAPITRIPGRIADAIIKNNNLDPAIREQVRVKIRDTGTDIMTNPMGVEERIAEIEALVKPPSLAA